VIFAALSAVFQARHLAVVIVALGLGAVGWSWLALHDRSVQTALIAKQAAAQAAADAVQHQRVVAVLGTALAEQRVAAEQGAAIKEEIARVAVTNDCVSSPAIAAALRGLRRAAATPPALRPGVPAELRR
jgi:hypothetical protein